MSTVSFWGRQFIQKRETFIDWFYLCLNKIHLQNICFHELFHNHSVNFSDHDFIIRHRIGGEFLYTRAHYCQHKCVGEYVNAVNQLVILKYPHWKYLKLNGNYLLVLRGCDYFYSLFLLRSTSAILSFIEALYVYNFNCFL